MYGCVKRWMGEWVDGGIRPWVIWSSSTLQPIEVLGLVGIPEALSRSPLIITRTHHDLLFVSYSVRMEGRLQFHVGPAVPA